MDLLRRSVRLALPLAIVLGGGGVMVWLVQSTPAPEAHAATVHVPTVAVQTVVPRTAVIPVVGGTGSEPGSLAPAHCASRNVAPVTYLTS